VGQRLAGVVDVTVVAGVVEVLDYPCRVRSTNDSIRDGSMRLSSIHS
jgi:hypothetical protein